MRNFILSNETILLNLWDKLHLDVDLLVNPRRKDLENNPPPDISGHWLRAARAMECRNACEDPGLRSETNPKGSRSEVVPPDIDRAKSEELGMDVAKLLPWHIAHTETAGHYTGNGAGSVHDHASTIVYKGTVDGKHHFFYKTKRSVKRTYTSDVSRVIMSAIYKRLNREHITTAMFGVIIVDQDKAGAITNLTSVVSCSDGRDPDLPERFKEISIWKKAERSATPA